jgi:hypothetical protein
MPMFDLIQNFAQCREYHSEQLSNGSAFGRSLWCGGQRREPLISVKEMGEKGEREKALGRFPLYFLSL